MSNTPQKEMSERDIITKFIVAAIAHVVVREKIINKIEYLLAKVTELENQIAERKEIAKQLMQSILKDAFGVK